MSFEHFVQLDPMVQISIVVGVVIIVVIFLIGALDIQIRK